MERGRVTWTLLGIFPHPDDEAYAAGGALALAARAGASVHVLTATRGEHGEYYHRAPGDSRPLAVVRTAELDCACRQLGAGSPRFLDLEDGRIANADFPAAVGLLVGEIRALRPQVVISLGPDGVYGHPDHIALYRLVVAAVHAAAGGDRFPSEQLGPPHRVQRLLSCAFPRGLFRPQYEHMLRTDLADAMRLVDPSRLGVTADEVAVELPIHEVAQRKLAALGCHRSQLNGEDPRSLFPDGIVERLLASETFTIAGPRPAGAPLGDLFAGLAP